MIALLENAKSLDLSENEKELLYYLENSCKEVVSMTLSQLAKATYMSNASIMRFCNKLGLSGFNELKYELKQSMHQEIDYQMIIEKPLSRFLDNLKNLNYEKNLFNVGSGSHGGNGYSECTNLGWSVDTPWWFCR